MKIFNRNNKNKYDLISISHFFYPRVGGLENMAYSLVSGLQEKGLNCVSVFGSNKKYTTTIDGFKLNSFKTQNIFNGTYPIFGIGFTIHIFNLLRKNPNAKVIVHSRHVTSSIITALVCILLGHKYTVIEHNADNAFFNSEWITKLATWADRNIFKFVPKFAENVIAVSEAGRKWSSKTFNLNEEDIDVIYNGYNSKEIRNYFSKKENIVVWAAKWIEVKDPSTALRGYKKIAKKYPDWKFVLIGQGKSLKRYKNLAENIEIIPKFIKQEDLFRLLRKSKIYINSSLSEGLGLASLEACAFGNIPVLSNAPSNKEIVRVIGAGTEKYIFKRGNAADLARSLKSAIEDSKEKGLHKNIAILTKENFLNKVMVDKYYENIFYDHLYAENISKLSIVIPVYNEEGTILKLLRKVSALELPNGIKKEIIIVNDNSTDRSLHLIEKFTEGIEDSNIEYKILSNSKNLGKSQTVKHGILHSTGDLVVVQDADLEYKPSDLVRFVDTFISEPYTDLIYGNRFNKDNAFINKTHFLGNKFVTTVSNIFTFSKGFRVKDMETCYKMGRGDIVRDVFSTLVSTTNFGLEPEATAKFATYRKKNKKRLNVKELDIYYKPRTEQEGKKMRWFKHGFEAIQEIVKFNVVRNNKVLRSYLYDID
jgi:glycosyltransferase involved in cell wall biosynthesis